MKLHLELFTTNICSRCDDAKHLMRGIVAELGDDQLELEFIDVVENIDHAVQTGVLSTPALALNGKLVFCPLPERGQVLRLLQSELKS